jgi:hypothetical protein
MPQFHYYAQGNCELPKCRHLTDQPCIVGEFATAAGKDWPDLKAQKRDQSIINRLSCLEEKGYPACFMWSARAIDPTTKWTEDARREVQAFNDRNRKERIEG